MLFCFKDLGIVVIKIFRLHVFIVITTIVITVNLVPCKLVILSSFTTPIIKKLKYAIGNKTLPSVHESLDTGYEGR